MEPYELAVKVEEWIQEGIILAWKVSFAAACCRSSLDSTEQQAFLDTSAKWIEEEYFSCGALVWV
jgi:hypothetical protein